MDIADGVKLIRLVFPEFFPDQPPCDTDEANTALLDWTGNGTVDAGDVSATLDYLFLGGAPHVLGSVDGACAAAVSIPDCPSVCL